VWATPRHSAFRQCLLSASDFKAVRHFVEGLCGVNLVFSESRFIFPHTISIAAPGDEAIFTDPAVSLALLLEIVEYNHDAETVRFVGHDENPCMMEIPLAGLIPLAVTEGWDFTDAVLHRKTDGTKSLAESKGRGYLIFNWDMTLRDDVSF